MIKREIKIGDLITLKDFNIHDRISRWQASYDEFIIPEKMYSSKMTLEIHPDDFLLVLSILNGNKFTEYLLMTSKGILFSQSDVWLKVG